MRKLYMIGNTHFDPVWLWKWDEAMSSILATFRSALARMDEDDAFIYSFAAPPVFEWVRKTDPALFEAIRKRIAEGRWETAEGWWVQPDCYAASYESYMRQSLYGQKYLMDNFGKYADCVFNIDSFGHSPFLPQILQKSHITCYCFVRPESRHIALEHPLFRWQSPDGSAVLACRVENAYSKELFEDEKDGSEDEDRLMVYGVTDHGGAPTKRDIRLIRKRDNAEFSTVSRFFTEHKDCNYTVTQELLTGDFGPYANYSKIKQRNLIAEYAVLNAECASLLADCYDAEKLADCWKDVLFNQFHDILGGACIKDAYFDAEVMQSRAIATADEIMHLALQRLTGRIVMPGSDPKNPWNIVVWNLNGAPFSGHLEAEVQWMHEFDWYDKGLRLEDADGNEYPCEIIREKSVIPAFRSRFVFRADIPSMGYKAFRLVRTGGTVVRQAVDPYRITTGQLSVEFSEQSGTICAVRDEADGRLLCGDLLMPVCYCDDGDTWCFNTDGYGERNEPFTFAGLRVVEANRLLTVLKAVYTYRKSRLELYYRFYHQEKYFDCSYRINWEEPHAVLKLECAIPHTRHRAAVPGGFVERDENRKDMPLSGWLDMGAFGVLSNGSFAYNVQDGRLGITLLRSPIYGDLRIGSLDRDADYDIIDRGITEGSLRLTFGECGPVQAAAFRNPPHILIEANHGGSCESEHSYFGIRTEGVSLLAMKKHEYGPQTVLHLCETEGKEKDVIFYVGGWEYCLPMTPFETATVRLDGPHADKLYITEDRTL